MNEAGLLDKWRSRFRKGKGRCVSEKKDDSLHRISLQNLSGAFVVFCVGIVSAVLVFIAELIIHHRSTKAINNQPKDQNVVNSQVEKDTKNETANIQD